MAGLRIDRFRSTVMKREGCNKPKIITMLGVMGVILWRSVAHSHAGRGPARCLTIFVVFEFPRRERGGGSGHQHHHCAHRRTIVRNPQSASWFANPKALLTTGYVGVAQPQAKWVMQQAVRGTSVRCGRLQEETVLRAAGWWGLLSGSGKMWTPWCGYSHRCQRMRWCRLQVIRRELVVVEPRREHVGVMNSFAGCSFYRPTNHRKTTNGSTRKDTGQ